MSQVEACGVCGCRVVLSEYDTRRGPEGLARCHEHSDTPAAVEVPEPVHGLDFVTEHEHVFTVHLSMTTRVTGWWDPDDPPGSDAIEAAAWEAMRRGDADDGNVEHIESQATGRTRRMAKGQPFDRNAWLRSKGIIPGRRAPRRAPGQRCLEGEPTAGAAVPSGGDSHATAGDSPSNAGDPQASGEERRFSGSSG